MAKSPPPQIHPSISMPSADLITYRFDQSDKNFAAINIKLDTIITQNSNFPTEQRAQQMIDESVQPFATQLESYRWFFRAIITGLILCTVGVVVALIQRR